MKTSLLPGTSLLCVAPPVAATVPRAPTHRALWKLPRGAHLDGLLRWPTRTGHLMKRFGIHLETLTGGCGEMEARVDFPPDGLRTIASSQDINDYQAFEFRALGGRRNWHGRLSYNLRYSSSGRFYFDSKWSPDQRTRYPVVKSARSHCIVAAYPALRFDDTYKTPIEFADDASAIFWVRNGVLWRAPFHPRGFK